MKNNRYT